MEMVRLSDVDPGILIDVKWAGADNMLGRQVYAANECYLRRETAERLARVNKRLQARDLRLKVWEGYRPMWMQQYLWDQVGDPELISDPSQGRRTHIRGAAVDVTLVDKAGRELDMPTRYCEFDKREQMKQSYAELPPAVLENRKTLRDAMTAEGFEIYEHEWWHYNLATWNKFPILDERLLVKPVEGIAP